MVKSTEKRSFDGSRTYVSTEDGRCPISKTTCCLLTVLVFVALAAVTLILIFLLKKTECGDPTQLAEESVPGDAGPCQATKGFPKMEEHVSRATKRQRNKICTQDKKARIKLHVSGYLWGDDCLTPVVGAKIAVWQRDSTGDFTNNCAGHVKTNSKGFYQFTTVYPGHEKRGNTYMASHINFKVKAKGYSDLLTRMYFHGDPFTQGQVQELMVFASHVTLNEPRSDDFVTFNIVLGRE